MEKEFTYQIYGTQDVESDASFQEVPLVILNENFPVYIEKGIDLTKGVSDNLVFKDQSLVLNGSATIGTYTSPVYQTEPFVRLNVMWGSITSPQATTSMEIRIRKGGIFGEWQVIGLWGYGGSNQPPAITFFVPETANEYQYRITLNRTNALIPSPQLKSVSINPVLLQSRFNVNLEMLPRHVLYEVPQLRQADTADSFLWNNICWATSISMVLQYYGKLRHLAVPQEYYAPLIRQGTERFGTVKNDIGATQFDMVVSEIEFHSLEMFLYTVAHFGPVIVGVSKGESPDGKFGPLTFSSGHVIVVVGFDISENGEILIVVNDPAVSWIREVFVGSSDEFMLVWDKGGILLQPLETIE